MTLKVQWGVIKCDVRNICYPPTFRLPLHKVKKPSEPSNLSIPPKYLVPETFNSEKKRRKGVFKKCYREEVEVSILSILSTFLQRLPKKRKEWEHEGEQLKKKIEVDMVFLKSAVFWYGRFGQYGRIFHLTKGFEQEGGER